MERMATLVTLNLLSGGRVSGTVWYKKSNPLAYTPLVPFPMSKGSQGPVQSPTKSQTKHKAQARRPRSGDQWLDFVLGLSEGLVPGPQKASAAGLWGSARSKNISSRGSEESFPRRASSAVPPAVVWPS